MGKFKMHQEPHTQMLKYKIGSIVRNGPPFQKQSSCLPRSYKEKLNDTNQALTYTNIRILNHPMIINSLQNQGASTSLSSLKSFNGY